MKNILTLTCLFLTACGGDFVVKSQNKQICLFQEYNYSFNAVDVVLYLLPTHLEKVDCLPYSFENVVKLRKEAEELNK